MVRSLWIVWEKEDGGLELKGEEITFAGKGTLYLRLADGKENTLAR